MEEITRDLTLPEQAHRCQLSGAELRRRANRRSSDDSQAPNCFSAERRQAVMRITKAQPASEPVHNSEVGGDSARSRGCRSPRGEYAELHPKRGDGNVSPTDQTLRLSCSRSELGPVRQRVLPDHAGRWAMIATTQQRWLSPVSCTVEQPWLSTGQLSRSNSSKSATARIDHLLARSNLLKQAFISPRTNVHPAHC